MSERDDFRDTIFNSATLRQPESEPPVRISAGLAAVEPPENFGNDALSKSMKPRTLKRYSMVNTTISHAYMREDPAGDWVMWSEAANSSSNDSKP